MTETVSKRNTAVRRSSAVTFSAKPTGLVIRVQMSQEDADAIAKKASSRARAKANASQAIRLALRDLKDEHRRDRSGFLQADIPSELRAELAKVAMERGVGVTGLILDLLFAWINPKTGELRMKKNKSGSRSPAGPVNYRRYAERAATMYSEALKSRSLSRLQVEVGCKVLHRIEAILVQNRISKGRFLTALAMDVRDRNHSLE
jgi:hypothetical protein